MGTFVRVCAWALCGLCGCASAMPAASEADLRHKLDEQARRTAVAEHKIDELENRVFLLTDQLESQKVASLHRQPRALPVVRLKPEVADDGAPPDESADAGARISDDRPRPSVRIDGSRSTGHRVPSKTLVRPDEELPAVGDDNLGVAPVPRIPAAPSAALPATASEPSERSAPANEPIALYRQAYDELRAGRHDQAARGFKEFVRRFPHHDYADNAQYWLGEVYYDQKRYDEAAPQFRLVVTRWPTANKAPDALVKLGFSLLALGRTSEGKAALREVPAAYPRTEAARLAQERLAQLSNAEGSK
jgi:tol-pal system protein YbgF